MQSPLYALATVVAPEVAHLCPDEFMVRLQLSVGMAKGFKQTIQKASISPAHGSGLYPTQTHVHGPGFPPFSSLVQSKHARMSALAPLLYHGATAVRGAAYFVICHLIAGDSDNKAS